MWVVEVREHSGSRQWRDRCEVVTFKPTSAMLLRKELSSRIHWKGNLLGPKFGPDVVMRREVPAPAGNRTPVARSYMLKRGTKCLGNLRSLVYLTHIAGHFRPLSHGIWRTRRAASNLTVARILQSSHQCNIAFCMACYLNRKVNYGKAHQTFLKSPQGCRIITLLFL